MEYAKLCMSMLLDKRPLFGYLLTCPRTGAWRGSV